MLSFRRLLGLTSAIGLALPAYAQTSTAAPPARVGQVADVNGSVSYNGAGSNGQWVAATANYPLTTGDSLFTQDSSQAAIAVDSSRVSLAPNTEIQISELDDTSFTATETQGEVFLNLTDIQPGQNYTIKTPRGAVTITQNGQYDIAAGDANDPTTVAVISGAANVGQLAVQAGEEGYLSGTDQTTAQLSDLQRDAFMNTLLAEMAPPPPPYVPPVVAQMTGAVELSNYGDWSQSPQYGAVWYPSVDAGWAPYREGHWAYVAPWGWTWVDVEPWGFAPFHYGRWIHDDGRWGWVAASAYTPGGGSGQDDRPVYAPAVVGFFGVGAGVTITASLFAHGNVGWVPLAPNEPYYPSYHADPAYIQRINRVDVHNLQNIHINDIHNTTIINNYANRQSATYIQASDMARGAAVGHYGRAVTPAMFAQARPVQGAAFGQALRPAYAPRAAEAPHPTEFAQRQNIPRPMISHAPADFHGPGGQGMQPETAPGFHPQASQFQHPEAASHMPLPQVYDPQPEQYRAPAPAYHPEAAPSHMPLPQVYHPQEEQYHAPAAPAYHAPLPQVYQPQEEQYHAPAPAYHPQEPAYHPEQPAYHPAEPQFHPQAPQFHPAEAPRPEAPRPGQPPQHHQQ